MNSHHSDPTTHALIYLPPPQPVVHPPTSHSHFPSHWFCHFTVLPPTVYIYTNTPSLTILHPPAYEDGTDSEFWNVGQQHTDAGDLPKRKWTTFTTRWKLKLKIKNEQPKLLVLKTEHFFYIKHSEFKGVTKIPSYVILSYITIPKNVIINARKGTPNFVTSWMASKSTYKYIYMHVCVCVCVWGILITSIFSLVSIKCQNVIYSSSIQLSPHYW
jgi:hypothetical protein